MVRKVISFTVFGCNSSYHDGAIYNAKYSHLYYPGWETWFYISYNLPVSCVSELSKHATKIIFRENPPYSRKYESLLWRFEAIQDMSVDIFLSRDCDSLPSYRESRYVYDWLESGLPAHIIRDHPYHTSLIQAGLFGLIPAKHAALFERMYSKNINYKSRRVDEVFLARYIYPRIASSAFYSTPFCSYEHGFHSDYSLYANSGYAGEPLFSNQQLLKHYQRVLESYSSSYLFRLLLIIRQLPSSLFYLSFIRSLYNVLSLSICH